MGKKELIEYWKKNRIVTNNNIIEAFKEVDRKNFVQERYKHDAYSDYPLPIPKDQTISQPTTVMIMTQALEPKKGHKILEVGTGSGYQAAILANTVGKEGKVISTEIHKELADFAKENLKKSNIENVTVLNIDGSSGYIKEAPYARIIVTAACPQIPDPLIEQLKIGGILLAPVGKISQKLIRLTKKEDKIKKEELGEFRFVPLTGEYGN